MSKDLLDKFAERERDFRQREFLAPFTPGSKTALVKMDGVNYEFRIVGHKDSGFGIFKPVDATCAKFEREPDYSQLRQYLDLLPKVNMILAYESDQGWVSYPMNLDSSKATLGLDSEIIVKNVSDSERFDVVTVRYDGAHFWHDEPFIGSDLSKSAAMRDCFVPDSTSQKMKEQLAQVKGLTPEDRRAFDLALMSWKLFQKVSTEDRIKGALSSGGGKLGRYVLRGDNVEIQWTSESGQKYTSLVKRGSLDVVSAGICLSNEDSKFHLKDLPFIIDQGEKRRAIYRMGQARGFDMEGDDFDEYDDDY